MEELERARREFASKLSLLKYEAGRLGLFCTMQKMESAVRMVGYELAGTPELFDAVKKAREKLSR